MPSKGKKTQSPLNSQKLGQIYDSLIVFSVAAVDLMNQMGIITPKANIVIAAGDATIMQQALEDMARFLEDIANAGTN